MTLYTVHAPKTAADAAPDPAALVFVKDGFCWPALFVPLIWLLWRRLWLVLLIYVAAVIILGTVARFAGTDASTAVLVLFAVWFALEANGLRRWTLERRGHALIGVVEGRNLEAAERRFFAAWPASGADVAAAPLPAPAAPMSARSAPSVAPAAAGSAQPPAPAAARPEPGIVGLFPAPGIRR